MRLRGAAGLACALALVAGCTGGPILANPPVEHPALPRAPSATARPPDPQPVRFPRDDGPHDRLTEWWYDTGHLATAGGRRFGFEFVVFRAERGGFPVSWASHLALTDEQGGRFLYAQRTAIGPQVDGSPTDASGPTGFAFTLPGDPGASPAGGPGASPAGGPGASPAAGLAPWRMERSSGSERLVAAASGSEVSAGGGGPATSFGIDLALGGSAPVLHDGDGWIDFGPSGGSYYYSRPRLAASGEVTLGGEPFRVTGTAWFDHQWGDFIAVGGGWDWFAVNLADGTDLTLSLVRDGQARTVLAYGTLVEAGTVRRLGAGAFGVTAVGTWRSPATGARYPAGWRIELPADGLAIDLRPTVAAQELDARASTSVAYWEGSQVVHATRTIGGREVSVGGEAYVELTGYGPDGPVSSGG